MTSTSHKKRSILYGRAGAALPTSRTSSSLRIPTAGSVKFGLTQVRPTTLPPSRWTPAPLQSPGKASAILVSCKGGNLRGFRFSTKTLLSVHPLTPTIIAHCGGVDETIEAVCYLVTLSLSADGFTTCFGPGLSGREI